jgi:hypothetical protein
MSDATGLIIEATPASRTQTMLTVRLAGDVLLVDKIDLSKVKARERFADALCEDRPGIDHRRHTTTNATPSTVARVARQRMSTLRILYVSGNATSPE